MEDDKDFLFENFSLAIFFGLSGATTLEDVHPPPVNLQRHSAIAAGHARVIPAYHLEAAEVVFPADMPLDESTVLGDDRQPEQEFQENALQPSINQLTICHCQRKQNPEESLHLHQQKDESQLAEVANNSDDDLNGVYPEHSEGDYMHNIEVGDEPSVVNFIGVEPLHQELDQADYSHHLVVSDTKFFSLGNPGDDGDLFLMQISMNIFD